MQNSHHWIMYLITVLIVTIFCRSALALPSSDILRFRNDNHQDIIDQFETENFEVAPGINYEYVYVKTNTSNESKATFLFIHGFPESYHSWRHQIEYFIGKDFDCLAPNLMGYGKTYSPLQIEEYKRKSMATHLVALLDHLNINKVIVVGHDWGVHLSSRFVLHNPQRTLGLILINGAYGAPAVFNLDQAIEYSKQVNGYETIGYWKFFIADDAAKIIENNIESFIDLAFANDPLLWKTDLAPVGKLRNWLTNGNRTKRASYMTENDYAIFGQYLAEGMQPKLNWYRSFNANLDHDDEKDIDPIIRQPSLFIGATEDYVVLPAAFEQQNQYVPDLEMVNIQAAHWSMIEKHDEVNQIIYKWIQGKI